MVTPLPEKSLRRGTKEGTSEVEHQKSGVSLAQAIGFDTFSRRRLTTDWKVLFAGRDRRGRYPRPSSNKTDEWIPWPEQSLAPVVYGCVESCRNPELKDVLCHPDSNVPRSAAVVIVLLLCLLLTG